MVKNKRVLASYKIIFGLLGLSAIVTEIVVLVSTSRFNPANFLSFFTIESNLFAAVVLLVSAVFLVRRKNDKRLGILRGAATLYMLTTGIVFALLLASIENAVLTAVPWDNIVLHYIMPVALIVDWLLDPPQTPIPFRRALVWLLYPVVYVTYSLIRGAAVGWYPYPFLNPETNGYVGILVTSLGITVTVLLLTWGLITVPKLLKIHRV